MASNALFTYKQVDVDPNHRGVPLKPYSTEYRTSVVESHTEALGGVNTEGSGIG